MIMPREIVRHELIGLHAEIVDSTNSALIGIRGKIIDETKNLIVIQSNNGIKKVLKSQIKMKTKIQDKEIILDGKRLVGRPEERIKNGKE